MTLISMMIAAETLPSEKLCIPWVLSDLGEISMNLEWQGIYIYVYIYVSSTKMDSAHIKP